MDGLGAPPPDPIPSGLRLAAEPRVPRLGNGSAELKVNRTLCCLLPLALVPMLGCPGMTPITIFPPGLQIGSDFATATPLPLDGSGKAKFNGTIAGSKIDVYDFGPCNPGDRIIISVRPSTNSPLDPTLAVFDANQEAFAVNDDADPASGGLDSAIDDTVTIGSDHYYMAIAKFFFDNVGGDYEADVEVRRGQGVPTPLTQRLLLNFGGGSITIPNEDPYTFGPFNAADVDSRPGDAPAYAGHTATIKARILEIVQQNYRNTGLQIFTSDNPPADNTGCVVTTIHFGAFSRTKFGVAQAVDTANRKRCDDGIVFTDDFDKPFANKPSVDGIAVAIGNVAAHEAGHLLGLNHTADVTDLMDTTGSASTLLADQEFKTAPFAPSIFPIGSQNGPALLDRVIPK